MTTKQTRRLLIVAFVLSLLLHLIVARFVRWPFRSSSSTTQVAQVVHVERVRAIQLPRVTPPPAPSPSPAPTAAPTAAPHRAAGRAASAHGGRPAVAVPTASAPAASPAPVVTATPNCAGTTTPVTVAVSPPPPEIPPDARTSTTGGTARVRVAVSAGGSVIAVSIAQSSGDPQLDSIALSMARAATYAPAMHACKPIASQYAYSVRFVAW